MKYDSSTLVAMFQHAATEYADRIALLHGEQKLTYTQLDQRANALARLLVKNGITRNEPIGLSAERSIDLIVGVLGILKAGGAYLPLDASYPEDRLNIMVEDAKLKTILTQKALATNFKTSNAELVIFEDIELKPIAVAPAIEGLGSDDLVFVLYTSGSTGRPKGVAMPHGPMVNLINWQVGWSNLEIGARTLQFAPMSFDASFLEIFSTFSAGGTLVLIEDELRLNALALLNFINSNKIERMIVPFVALNYLADIAYKADEKPTTLKEIITSGEQLKITPAIRNFFKALDGAVLYNQYGPTECHVVSDYVLTGDPDKWPALPPIGKAITNVDLYVLDEDMNKVPDGTSGELFIGGDCIARGYLYNEELTSERFIPDPFKEGGRLYKTGDQCVVLEDGNIDFQGRIDGQVKVRGYRIELGEVEVALGKFEGIGHPVVTVREDRPGEKKLVGYFIPTADVDMAALRKHMEASVPEYMVPSSFVQIDDLPRTPSGKIDRKALPAPDTTRPDLGVTYVAPTTDLEKNIATLWADLLNIDKVGIEDNFYDFGGNSLMSIQCIARLKQEHNIDLPIVKIFQYPTIKGIVSFLGGADGASVVSKAHKRKKKNQSEKADIAIVGMSGKFPGAENVDELWNNLFEGKESISVFKADELDASIPEEIRKDPDYVPARGVIKDADKFDAAFFGVNPKTAELMDPQQRVFLETAWAAIEDAGYDPEKYDGMIGVYVGMGNNTYYPKNVLSHPEKIQRVGEFQTMVSNEKDYIATRLSYEFNLNGPSLSIHTACSTSLTAISEAYFALKEGRCDMALAGGIAITVPINSGHVYQEGGMYCPDGHCRPFDADANGTMFSDGVGVVMLKRLDEALEDGDQVYGVIKGAALNNDGSDKASFTAPSVKGQAEVIALAQAEAGVDPGDISYIETHGTATPLGDPIEVEGLTLAFRNGTDKNGFCGIGSIKSNIGHLTPAAGVAGLIKTTLALRNEVLPASLNFDKPNPAIDLDNSPFYVAAKKQDWTRTEKPRYAGISSFGVGGTNAHVIVSEAPDQDETSTSRPKQLLLLSAKSSEALDEATTNLAAHLKQLYEKDLADAAYTLQIGRKGFTHRRAIVVSSAADGAAVIEKKDPQLISSKTVESGDPEIVFMFPGQGSQYVNMGKNLYDTEPVFKAAADECFGILEGIMGYSLKDIMYPSGDEEKAAEELKRTINTQPALFVIEYGLAKLWMSWGIQPDAMMGHSIAEFVAATLSGVFKLEDGLKVVAERGRMMQELPEGSMLSIRAAESDVAPRLKDTMSIAANNGPALCVAAGPDDDIAALQKELKAEEIVCKLLFTSHAFHSPMMDPMLGAFEELVGTFELSAPRIPFISTVTSKWISAEEATDPKYWAGHVRGTVRFADAVKTAWEDKDRLMLEVGPRTTAATLARQQSKNPKTQVAISSLADNAEDNAEWTALLKAIGGVWLNGGSIDWNAFYERETRRRISMPTYPFKRERHWVDPVAMMAAGGAVVQEKEETPAAEVDSSLPRKEQLIPQIKEILEESSGIEMDGVEPHMTFMEIGLDSLFLTQVATTLSKTFGVKVTFRQLNEDLSNLDMLSAYLDEQLPADGGAVTAKSAAPAASPESGTDEDPTKGKTFGAQAKILKEEKDELSPSQRAFLNKLIEDYTKKTAKSKVSVEADRPHSADPRVVTGFKPLIKEIVYPVVVNKSHLNRLWDIDGNEYIDILNGFGSSLFGYMPDFIKEAAHKQLDDGIEIGPQHPMAGEVTKLLCELTGQERAGLCNTGSEAVLGAMRIARTVTGRSTIVSFNGAYHGINDEVIIRGSKKLKSYPAAPGIMKESVENMLVLDYGTPEALEIIRERADEIAAVMVEPVQSRRLEFRPVDFLKEVRRITAKSGAALIFDEVITGFRTHPGGAQALFGIRADIATYGKVIGGGMPIGAVIGKREWLDALDGGQWQFGDDSIPEVGVTYFAGTFVRHPLTLACAKASLLHMKEEGPALQDRLNKMTDDMGEELNTFFEKENIPYWMVNFGSAFKVKYDESVPYIELLFHLMRLKGIHVWDGFPCFITTAHTEADMREIIDKFKESALEMKAAGFLPSHTYKLEKQNTSLNGHAGSDARSLIMAADEPPIPGARLGINANGEPSWYVPDPDRDGKYLQLVNDLEQ